VDHDRTAGASYSLVYIGKGCGLSVLEPERITEIMLLKNVRLEDSSLVVLGDVEFDYWFIDGVFLCFAESDITS